MKTLEIKIEQSKIWYEVAKTTSYIGGNMPEDEKAYERISLTDANAEDLERFWAETASVANENLKEFLAYSEVGEEYIATLNVDDRYNDALTQSVKNSIESFFVDAIVSKWCMYVNKGEAEVYAGEAISMLDNALRKLHNKKRPTPPKRNYLK